MVVKNDWMTEWIRCSQNVNLILLIGLALSSLLPVQDETICQRFDAIIQCICETLNDIMKEDIEYSEDGNESNGLVE